MRARGEKVNKVHPHKYGMDFSIFESIDSQEKAYWLGFFYADGCVTDVGVIALALSLKDEDHIKKFKKFLKSEKPIQYATRINKKNKRTYYECTFRFTSKKVLEDLCKLGIYPNKSLTLQFPRWLESDYLKSFLRGYFDGDGSFSYTFFGKPTPRADVTIVGTKDFLQEYKRIVTKDLGINMRLSPVGRIFRLTIGGNLQIRKFMDWIYSDNGEKLERKSNKYQEFLNIIG